MSDEEESNLIFYGSPLEPYSEDAFPKRKPISVEDQIATDSHGRRRFHGAFTGGFSAGFFNTVGSLEGWTPSEFKSTRSEKADTLVQKPQDFMDDEDISEYGIAPQTIKATKDYSTIKKRSRQVFSDGPIPGVPVLETLITSGNETVGYILLRNMGIEDKIKKKEQELNSEGKVYGCEMPTTFQISDDIREKEYQIPDIYKEYLKAPKSNTAGLDYKGLSKPHVNLFHSTNLVVRDKNDKKFSIGGQAFGVGAFEDEDDDIYMKEDMSNYDFELTKEKDTSSSAKGPKTNDLVFGMFKKCSAPLISKKTYIPPTIPHWFTGIHKIRKSRFEPLEEKVEPVPRSQINPAIRARYLGEEVSSSFTASKIQSDKSEGENNTSKKTEDNENYKKKIDVASPLSDRFVSASKKEDVTNILDNVEKSDYLHGTPQMRDASKMKMYGPLTRITSDWHPCSVLCKRFNVPEPFVDHPKDRNQKKTKNLIFQSQKFEEHTDNLKPGISNNLEELSENITEEEIIKVEPEDGSTTSNLDSSTRTENATTPLQRQTNVNDIKIEAPPDIKTAETRPVDFTEKIGIEDKIDLYKAVFLSSSESEDEEAQDQNTDMNTNEDQIQEFKTNVLSEPLIPKIKPMKTGILSGIDFKEFNRNRNNQQQNETAEEKNEENPAEPTPKNPLLYGPPIPANIIKNNQSYVPKKIVISSESEDEWVEKDSSEHKKKSKHKKKDKKQKHKKRKKKYKI